MKEKLWNKCCNAMYAQNNQSLLLFLQSGTLAAKSSPSFLLEIKDQRASVGESVKFICKFAGTPNPGRYYYNPSEILNIAYDSERKLKF